MCFCGGLIRVCHVAQLEVARWNPTLGQDYGYGQNNWVGFEHVTSHPTVQPPLQCSKHVVLTHILHWNILCFTSAPNGRSGQAVNTNTWSHDGPYVQKKNGWVLRKSPNALSHTFSQNHEYTIVEPKRRWSANRTNANW